MLRSRDLGHAEIRDLDRAVLVDHDVGRLDVAVNDALFVGIIQCCRGLVQHVEDGLLVRWLIAEQQLFQRRPVHALHRDVGDIGLFAHVVNHHDAGMRQSASRLSLAEQPLAQLFPLGLIGQVRKPDCLDGYRAADSGVLRAVDDTHRSAAQFTQNLVPPDRFHVAMPL